MLVFHDLCRFVDWKKKIVYVFTEDCDRKDEMTDGGEHNDQSELSGSVIQTQILE